MANIVEMDPADLPTFTKNPEAVLKNSIFLTQVWIYLFAEEFGNTNGSVCRKMFVGNEKGPLAECRTVTIQKGTRYPSERGTFPVVTFSTTPRKYPWWYISLVSVEKSPAEHYRHHPGLVQTLGGVVDGHKVEDLNWPKIVTDTYDDDKGERIQVEVGTAAVLSNGLVKIDLADDCCVAVYVKQPVNMNWDDCLTKFGPPVAARP